VAETDALTGRAVGRPNFYGSEIHKLSFQQLALCMRRSVLDLPSTSSVRVVLGKSVSTTR
jgi:hypothetical protein